MAALSGQSNSKAVLNVVYLLHFERPYEHAQHYLGSAKDLRTRLAQHQRGNGARLMRVIADAGIAWRLARVWKFSGIWEARRAESDLKRHYKNGRRLCPICKGRKGGGECPQT